MINLYARDLSRTLGFYLSVGFRETFRTPQDGEPEHVELALDGFTLGIASVEAAVDTHGLPAPGAGRGIEIVFWSDDVDASVAALASAGAPILSPAHDFLDGKLRSAWVGDPEGNPIQVVQRKAV